MPVLPYRTGLGVILSPSKLDIPQASTCAVYSCGQVASDIIKVSKNTSGGYVNRPGFFRTIATGSLYNPYKRVNLTNLARWQNTSEISPKTGRCYNFGTPYIFARNIWRKLFKNKKHRCLENELLMNTNEGIAFQKGDVNPIAGLIIAGGASYDEKAFLLKALTMNSGLQLYLYNVNAKDYCMRVISRENALQLLAEEAELSGERFARLFTSTQPNSIEEYIDGEDPSFFRNISGDHNQRDVGHSGQDETSINLFFEPGNGSTDIIERSNSRLVIEKRQSLIDEVERLKNSRCTIEKKMALLQQYKEVVFSEDAGCGFKKYFTPFFSKYTKRSAVQQLLEGRKSIEAIGFFARENAICRAQNQGLLGIINGLRA